MAKQIEAILFDMGGTLRKTVGKGNPERQELIQQMIDLLGLKTPLDEFASMLETRANAYRHWAQETLIELSEVDLWTKWMLPDMPPEKIKESAAQLNHLYHSHLGTKIVYPETSDVLMELFRRGYRLGLVSNTTSRTEVPAVLRELNISGCFEVVILSTDVGIRKPNPAILFEATRRMKIEPENCAYVGDRIDRDVAAARNAGFSKAIILHDPRQKGVGRGDDPRFSPDHLLTNLTGLLEIFPRRSPPQPARTYDASLSTMWAIRNFPTLADFFEAARRMGFNSIELNHKVTSRMLEYVDPTHYHFSSIHEPCPADVSEDDLKKRDWLISSIDEKKRIEGVKAIKRSIETGGNLGIPVVVIHAGQTIPDQEKLEKKLRDLVEANQHKSDEYQSIFNRMIQLRREHGGESFAALQKSTLELLKYAESFNIKLGFENRYHYLEHPSPDELEILLGLANPEQLGFVFDLGHAEALDRLGFYRKEEWLERFGSRILGVHLHDIITTADHYAAGLGDADFEVIAGILPQNAFRTCEFQNFNTPEEVQAGLEFLVKQKCIKQL